MLLMVMVVTYSTYATRVLLKLLDVFTFDFILEHVCFSKFMLVNLYVSLNICLTVTFVSVHDLITFKVSSFSGVDVPSTSK